MQGIKYFTGQEDTINFLSKNGTRLYANKPLKVIQNEWLKARDKAIECATHLNNMGVTKQLCNRLLEPFMWHTVLISGTEWDNFFELRCPSYEFETLEKGKLVFKSWKEAIRECSNISKTFTDNDLKNLENTTVLEKLSKNKGQAEIHMMQLAECIWDAFNESNPVLLKPGEWHIPFEDKINIEDLIIKNNYDNIDLWEEAVNKDKVKISTAMAARTSYTVVGDEKEFSYKKQIELHDRMANQVPFHASPFEHCARVMSDEEYFSNLKGNVEGISLDDDGGALIESFIGKEDDISGWCRNYRGFIQYRHILETKDNQ